MNKFIFGLYAVILSSSVYANQYLDILNCKDVPILEYVYDTEDGLLEKHKSNNNSYANMMKFGKKFSDIGDHSSAMQNFKNATCYKKNNKNIENVLKKDHKYTDKMIKELE